MIRRVVLSCLMWGCGDSGSGESTFGDTSPSGGTTVSNVDCSTVGIPGCNEVVEVCEGGQCECQCADAPTTTQSPGTTTAGPDESSTSSAATSTGTTTDPTSSGATTNGTAALGECTSVDIWESCAQYCSSVSESCVDGGCDGATVHYYGGAPDCIDMVNADVSAQACDEPLQSSGGTSFARCCCG